MGQGRGRGRGRENRKLRTESKEHGTGTRNKGQGRGIKQTGDGENGSRGANLRFTIYELRVEFYEYFGLDGRGIIKINLEMDQ